MLDSQLEELNAIIAQHEALIKSDPEAAVSPSMAANIRSLRKLKLKLDAEAVSREQTEAKTK